MAAKKTDKVVKSKVAKVSKTTQKPVLKPRCEDKRDAMLDTFRSRRLHPTTLKKTDDTQWSSTHGNLVDEICDMMETFAQTSSDAYTRLLNQVIRYEQDGSPEDVNQTLALIAGLRPQDELEGMLATQMAICHNMAMGFAARSMRGEQTYEQIDRQVNRVTKLMRTFTAQVETLAKYRNKGKQTIQVQHVNVNEGGQAIVGNVSQGGGGDDTKKSQ